MLLPLGTSAVTLGFGYMLALGQPPLDLRASPVLVPIAHTLVAFPFVVRAVVPALRGLNPHWREAAAVPGRRPWRVWREVELPIVGRAVLVGAVFAFTISMGEFGATLLIARPEYPTMPVAIYRLLGQPGALNYGQALAMSTLLMLVCGSGFVLSSGSAVGRSRRVLSALLESISPNPFPSCRCSTTSASTMARERSSACWDPAAAARARCCTSSRDWSSTTPAGVRFRRRRIWRWCPSTGGALD